MIDDGSPVSIPDEVIISKIYLVRGVKIMLDRDLADLYGIDTKVLKQSVRRNIKHFPLDFMFEMLTDEFHEWRSQPKFTSPYLCGLIRKNKRED
jgi:hypothetical protein